MDTPPTIEHELQRKPPRQIVNRNGKWGDVVPWLFLLIPHFWIAIIAPFAWFTFVINAFCAEPMPAKVTRHHMGHSKGNTTYRISYEIDSNNTITKGQGTVDKSQYDSLKVGDNLTVYTLRWMPWFSPRLEKDVSSVFAVLAFLTFWCLLWCGITFSVVFAMLDQPLRSKWLVKYGTPLLATIKEVQMTKGRNSNNYKLLYEYEAKTVDKKTGKKVTTKFNGKMSLKNSDASEAESLKEHQVTALIDDKKPQKSIVYRFCAHKAVG